MCVCWVLAVLGVLLIPAFEKDLPSSLRPEMFKFQLSSQALVSSSLLRSESSRSITASRWGDWEVLQTGRTEKSSHLRFCVFGFCFRLSVLGFEGYVESFEKTSSQKKTRSPSSQWSSRARRTRSPGACVLLAAIDKLSLVAGFVGNWVHSGSPKFATAFWVRLGLFGLSSVWGHGMGGSFRGLRVAGCFRVLRLCSLSCLHDRPQKGLSCGSVFRTPFGGLLHRPCSKV